MYTLGKIIRKIQTLTGVGAGFSVETAIASRAVLDKNNNPVILPDNPGMQLIVTDTNGSGQRWSLVMQNGVFRQLPVSTPLV